MRHLSYWVGTALLVLGVVILAVTGALYAYGILDDLLYSGPVYVETPVAEADPPTEEPVLAPTVLPTPAETPDPTWTPEPASTPVPAVPSATVTSTPAESATPTVTTVLIEPQPATRIKAASIKLDAPATESVISNGQWVVPKFAAGHLQGTGQPGVPGNAVYAGHVSSRSSGDVFASIGKLKTGDEVILVTKAGHLLYQVTDNFVVKNNDLSVTKDFGDERITLVTCTGNWLPLQRDFDRRLIVVARRTG